MAISLSEFEKALVALEAALSLAQTDITRDASIQRFEFVVELAWKTARKTMGTRSSAPKEVVREMARNDLITDPELWFEALEMRNLSSHTYNESKAKQVYSFAAKFVTEARSLLEKLKKK